MSSILNHIHSKGIVHRDIKFDNFIENDGVLYLIDFETALIYDFNKAVDILKPFDKILNDSLGLYRNRFK